MLQTVAAFGTIALAIVAAFWSQFSKISSLEYALVEIRTQNTRSIDERLALIKEAEQARKMITDLQSQASRENAERSAALIEIETQFRSSDQARNIERSDQQRTNALLWEKIFGGRYPSDTVFYPNISK